MQCRHCHCPCHFGPACLQDASSCGWDKTNCKTLIVLLFGVGAGTGAAQRAPAPQPPADVGGVRGVDAPRPGDVVRAVAEQVPAVLLQPRAQLLGRGPRAAALHARLHLGNAN